MKALAAVSQGLPSAPLPDPSIQIESNKESVRPEGAIWIGLHFPQLVLDSFDPPEGIPAVIIEEQKNGPVVYAIDWGPEFSNRLQHHFVKRTCWQLREEALRRCSSRDIE